MLIKKIEIKNDKVLWNVIFDFLDKSWNISKTIIFAWENWAWKTNLLNFINDLSNSSDHIRENFTTTIRDFKIHLFFSDEEMKNLTKWYIVGNYFKREKIDFEKFEWNDIIYNYDIYKWPVFFISYKTKDWKITKNAEIPWSAFADYWDSDFEKLTKVIFSSVIANFTTYKSINQIAYNTWSLNNKSISDEKLTEEIINLFLKIRQEDNEDLSRWVDENPWIVPIDDVKHKRFNKFNNAFSYFFDDKIKFKWIESSWWKLTPIFQKEKVDIPIHSLSSWEKQIIFRGAYLLQANNEAWSIILIDEPETSLHPKWQQKILEYYRNLFRDEKWNQSCQIFCATHSPYLIQWFNFNDWIIFIPPYWIPINNLVFTFWPNPSFAMVNYITFKIASFELHDELYSYIEDKGSWDFEKFIISLWEKPNCTWIDDRNPRKTNNFTLYTCIRHKIHHPNNILNDSKNYMDKLSNSIDWMISIIVKNKL